MPDSSRASDAVDGRAAPPGLWPLLRQLIFPHRWTLIGCFGLLVAARLASLVLPLSLKYLVDDVVAAARPDRLYPLIAVVLGAQFVQATAGFALTRIAARVTQKVIVNLRRRVYEHLVRLPVAFYSQHTTGTLIARLMQDIDSVRHLAGSGLLQLAGSLTTAIVAFVLLLGLSPTFTGVVLVAAGALSWMLPRAYAALQPLTQARAQANAEVSGRLAGSLEGIRVVKAYHAEQADSAALAARFEHLSRSTVRSGDAAARSTLVTSLGLDLLVALLLFLGAREILAARFTMGAFVAFTTLMTLLVAPMLYLATISGQVSEALTALRRTRELLACPPEDDAPTRTHRIGRLRGDVVFEHVSFGYDPERRILHDLSFRAAPGTMTALVGPSGAGKSSIAALIAAFHAPGEGRILIDGIDLQRLTLDSYRSQLGVVFQDTFLFEGTIRDNVAFARPAATTAEILRACRLAGLDEVADGCADGYDTQVGERGARLAGGQRQRVAIARAILADPRILILDEPTSNLDLHSEASIQRAMATLLQERTTFVVAHRLSTIRTADQILYIADGRIVERGTHDVLIAARGRYYDLHRLLHEDRHAGELVPPI